MSEERGAGPIERMVDNLSAVLKAGLPGRSGVRVHAGAADFLVAAVAVFLVGLIAAAPEALSFGGLRGLAGDVAFIAGAVLLVAALAGRAAHVPAVAVGLLWALALGQGLAAAAARWLPVESLAAWLAVSVAAAALPGVLFLTSALGAFRGGLAGIALFAAVTAVALDAAGYWDEPEVARAVPDTEAVYAAQAALLAREAGDLRPGTPGETELFALLGAGDPYEGVFAREVDAVADRLADQFNAEGRVLRLVNAEGDPVAYPLLNRSNLAAALEAIAGAMNEEDILLVFLTSHGAPGALATQFEGAITRDISARDLARALDGAAVPNAVVIVSACYSGSFIEDLRAPDRLVLTASRADRSSFGCTAGAEWTDWGRAFFDEALERTDDPRAAALIARDLVALSEAEKGYEPSEPQIAEGAEIGAVLDRLLEGLR